MVQVRRRKALQLSAASAVSATTGGLAGILASGRAPAYAQGTTRAYCVSQAELRRVIANRCKDHVPESLIVRVAEAPSPVHISMRHGTVMSLSGTASGRLFAAHLPVAVVQAALGEEPMPEAALLQQVRRQGLASSKDAVVQGVSALAVPVFDDSARIVLSLTVIGPSGSFDLRVNGALAPTLKQAGEDLSRQLGWRPAE